MKVLSAALAATATAAALVFVGVTPAFADGNAIDPGDAMFAVNCDSVYNDWQLLGVESTTAVSTPIGTGSGSVDEVGVCAGQPAYDATTGMSYYIQWSEQSTVLASIDTVTGATTVIDQFIYQDGEFPTPTDVDAIAIGIDGAAYALSSGTLFGLDLATAELTPIAETLSNVYGFAVDPTTGDFYVVQRDGTVYAFDVTDGTTDEYGTLSGFPEGDEGGVYSLQIDGGGLAWIQKESDGEVDTSTLWSFSLENGNVVYSGIFDDDPYYTQALLIIPGEVPPPKPELASTGTDTGFAPLAAGALVLLGAAFILIRRRVA